MAKKLTKTIEGSIVTLTAGETPKSYDFSKLPKEIQAKFGPFGLGHKLGDSAAGVEGVDAIFQSIDKVWEGLMVGNWSVKAPAGEKVSISVMNELVGTLSAKDKNTFKAMLEKRGMTLDEAGKVVKSPTVASA